jgi:hypothetical protein
MTFEEARVQYSRRIHSKEDFNALQARLQRTRNDVASLRPWKKITSCNRVGSVPAIHLPKPTEKEDPNDRLREFHEGLTHYGSFRRCLERSSPQPPRKENVGSTVWERTRLPPGKTLQTYEGKKSVKWGQVEEQRVGTHNSDEYGFLSGKEAQELAHYLMDANPFFLGTMQGGCWQHPRLDVDRFLHNEVNYAEYLYWFHLYASVGLRRPDPPGLPGYQKTPHAQAPSPLNPTLTSCVPLSFEPGNYMTFNDIVSRNHQMSAIYIQDFQHLLINIFFDFSQIFCRN